MPWHFVRMLNSSRRMRRYDSLFYIHNFTIKQTNISNIRSGQTMFLWVYTKTKNPFCFYYSSELVNPSAWHLHALLNFQQAVVAIRILAEGFNRLRNYSKRVVWLLCDRHGASWFLHKLLWWWITTGNVLCDVCNLRCISIYQPLEGPP